MTPLHEGYVEIAREQVAVPMRRLRELLAARLGLDDPHPAWLDDTEMALLEDPESPVTMTPPDVVVHVPALAAGIVLTHRLSAAEHVEDYVDLDVDLAVFQRFPAPTAPVDRDDGAWLGPEGWLAGFPLDALLAARVAADGTPEISALDPAPVAPPAAVAALRAVYDEAVATHELPVPAEMLVVGMLLRDREAFARPLPPIAELAAAAGLERHGDEFAHHPSVWARADDVDRELRMVEILGPDAEIAREALDLLSGTEPAALRRALDLLADPDVLLVVVDELLDEHGHGCDHDAERVKAVVALADRLLAVAGHSPRAAAAGWIAMVAAERDGRVLDAESHLRAAAVAGAGWEVVEDRLAGYESDRGDAAAALARWSAIGADDDPDVVVIRPYAVAAGPEPGRNEPCWCGSGRKYKQCHLGRPVAAPLPERAAWLYRKAVAYLERRGGAATDLLDVHAAALAGDGADPLDDDPLAADTVLDEGGWFARFLADRGPLLPADERELAASWVEVRRSVFEVMPGGELREVRGDARLAVAGPAPAAGEWVCARALPDGAGRHLLVAPVVIDRDDAAVVASALADRDPIEVLDLLAVDAPEPRSVLRLGPASGPSAVHPATARPVPPTVPPVVRQLQERREQRWCDEPAPALDGLTPREAAADPARREALLALIAAAPPDDPATGKLGLRPARLRELLGLA
jgi:SEC-C motif